MSEQEYPKFRRFTPAELREMLDAGRIFDFVPNAEIDVQPLGPHHVQLIWARGPRGHALIGQCPDGCHTVVEYPAQWRSRGREIADGLRLESFSLMTQDQAETMMRIERTLDRIRNKGRDQ